MSFLSMWVVSPGSPAYATSSKKCFTDQLVILNYPLDMNMCVWLFVSMWPCSEQVNSPGCTPPLTSSSWVAVADLVQE